MWSKYCRFSRYMSSCPHYVQQSELCLHQYSFAPVKAKWSTKILGYSMNTSMISCSLHSLCTAARRYSKRNFCSQRTVVLHNELCWAQSHQTTWILCYKQYIQTFSSCFSSSVVLLCTRRLCCCKWPDCLKTLSHSEHLMGSSTVWTLMWFCKCAAWLYALPHT